MAPEDANSENQAVDRAALRDLMLAAAQAGASQDDIEEQPTTEGLNEEDALRNLTGAVRDQNELERDITLQANAALMEADDKKDQNRIDKLQATKHRLQLQLDKEKKRLEKVGTNIYQSRNIQKEIAKLDDEIQQVSSDISDFQARIEKRHQENPAEDSKHAKSKKLPGESNREFLIRTGKITPFAKIGGPRPSDIEGQLADTILDAEEQAEAEQLDEEFEGPTSHQRLRRPGFVDEFELEATKPATKLETTAVETEFSLRPRKKRRVQRDRSPSADFEPEGTPDSESGDDGVWQQGTEDDLVREQRRTAKAKAKLVEETEIDLSKIDDGNAAHYKKRLNHWVVRRSRARRARRQGTEAGGDAEQSDEEEEEWFKPAPDFPDHHFGDGLKLPGDIHPSLFGYQKTGVQWLAELYKQHVGGIVGDEMGLGKTVQLIAFLAALHYSKKLTRPVIVVAPATLLRQWVSEFHRWWPPLRVAILHASGSGMMDPKVEDEADLDHFKPLATKSEKAARRIVNGVVKNGHVLVTTYAGLQTYADTLLPVHWDYAVLDEGHKIRNPNAEITVTCKELNTPNRVILSGTPVQNNLTELWSLFDFIYPMRLGTLVNFRTQFEIPIRQGGYANASNLQVMTAEKCAEALKETISEYLLQRLKVDVAADLPEKTEQVLFCKLTDGQRKAYETFLKSDEVSSILSRTRQSLYGIDILRKICNHPDLLDKSLGSKPGYDFGNPKLSAKLQLTKDLLQKVMIPNGHKTLLFSQGKQMLNIIEKCIRECDISYVRMDGETPVDQRQPMIDKFNEDPNIHVFLMTTRTGGLGTNLTGADRIIIFDPDWNPSTDLQARERAWRLGQKKPVKIYRLMTEGTIEEKIYHRQIFKQFMTNKVLKDPKQRSSYDLSDLYDLFSFNPVGEAGAQRSEVFKGAEVDLANADGGEGGDQNVQPISSIGRDTNDAEGRELQQMDLVAAMEEFKEDKTAHDEKRMLEGIFAKSVNSAYDHEQIVNGPQKAKADMSVLRHEANQVARQAAAHLRQAGLEARRVPIGTVTWTGEVGQAGRPGGNRRRGGPGSTGIISNLADRQGLDGGSGSSSRSGTPGSDRNLKAKDFVAMIKTFINRHNGRVPSKMLVDHFNPYCPGKKQSDEFKAALDRVAVLNKSGGAGRGIWTLKPGVK
ncbi:transcription-coupled repair protein CSB/RAD26 [Fusarium vanettenii 77-13-4]|uniref:Transcription-coupled repair protein CSB/RAD26 n=1 Tax=Fusarium vanettenii (strain ATCC MYA-4622 / CBS 123669 / FGSC 9596 / NRRL 45880 / 77-13-4) TaxID=660122 RepID=C7Z9T3_FUSV7|nr:transcription-coupled repair protein CSB/RAD26 [Fusarium vanettenii 77-13-4]EEU39557.1 transcription-coupled repair protein CSB/RAD26 [Fusarium vanettenii 77-13-4]